MAEDVFASALRVYWWKYWTKAAHGDGINTAIEAVSPLDGRQTEHTHAEVVRCSLAKATLCLNDPI